MRIKPSLKQLLLNMSLLSVAAIAIIMLATFNWTTMVWINANTVLLAILVVISVAFIIFIIQRNYYELTNNGLVQQMIFKKNFYSYLDILFIDEDHAKKDNQLIIYNRNGSSNYFIMDSHQILLSEMKKRCPNLLTKEEYHHRFPNVKLK